MHFQQAKKNLLAQVFFSWQMFLRNHYEQNPNHEPVENPPEQGLRFVLKCFFAAWFHGSVFYFDDDFVAVIFNLVFVPQQVQDLCDILTANTDVSSYVLVC